MFKIFDMHRDIVVWEFYGFGRIFVSKFFFMDFFNVHIFEGFLKVILALTRRRRWYAQNNNTLFLRHSSQNRLSKKNVGSTCLIIPYKISALYKKSNRLIRKSISEWFYFWRLDRNKSSSFNFVYLVAMLRLNYIRPSISKYGKL